MAQVKTLINKFGKVAGWNSIKTVMMGRELEGIIELSYNDSKEKENIYGAGGMPIGRGEGNYKAEATVTLTREEIIALQLAVGSGKSILDIEPFDIPVIYEYGNLLYKDVIRNCEFTNNPVSVKQNDKSISQQLTLLVSHIDWNVPI